MEGNAEMADFALRFQFKCRFVGFALPVMLKISGALGVHEVEIEILNTAGIQLLLKQRTDILPGFEET